MSNTSTDDGILITFGYDRPITVYYWQNGTKTVLRGCYNNQDRKPGHINIDGTFIPLQSIIDIN